MNFSPTKVKSHKKVTSAVPHFSPNYIIIYNNGKSSVSAVFYSQIDAYQLSGANSKIKGKVNSLCIPEATSKENEGL